MQRSADLLNAVPHGGVHIMASAIVYGLSCLDGPILYVGATRKDISKRVSEHWGLRKSGPSPVNIWLRRFHSKSDLTSVVLHTTQECSLKYRELSEIRSRALSVWNQHHILILNVPHNPYRYGGDLVNLQAMNGEAFRLAEYVNPYSLVTKSEAEAAV